MDERDEERIFEEALRISSPAERIRYLQEACGDDKELLAEVQSLLDGYEAGEFLERTIPPISAVREQSLRRPDSIGPYRLGRELGEGGMGTVFLAEQQEPVSRRVAIKLIRADRISASAVRRFIQEQKTLSLMTHPNIASVLDAGTTAAGLSWFAMEFVDGIPILKFCQLRNPDLQARLGLILECCQAIQHAHQKRILHRDIKPSNVLVTEVDGRPIVKLIDFGVAKPLAVDSSAQESQTRAGDIIGTPLYMSPEQALSGNREIDTRADIYSVGALMYAVLTGVPPFDAKRMQEADTGEVRRILKEEEPIRPSVCLRQQTRQHSDSKSPSPALSQSSSLRISSELDAIVMKAMSKEPERRYQTIGELADDIEAFLDSRPIRARAPSTLYFAGKFARRHRGLLSAVAAAFTCLLIGLAVALQMYLVAAHNKELALQTADESARQRYSSDMRAAASSFLSHDARTVQTLLEPYRNQPTGSSVAPGFEWKFLDRCVSLNSELKLKRNDSLYCHCRISGDLLATAGSSGVITVVHGSSGTVMREWNAGQGEVNDLAVNPGGTLMASAGDDGTIAVWNTETWQESGPRIQACQRQAFSCAWSPDGRYLAVCGNEPNARIFRFSDRKLCHEVKTERDLECLSISERGMLAVGAEGGTVYLQQLPKGDDTFLEPLQYPNFGQITGAHCTALSFSSTDQFLSVGYNNGVVGILQLRDPMRLHKLVQFSDSVESLLFGPSDDKVVVGLRDSTLCFIRTEFPNQSFVDLIVQRKSLEQLSQEGFSADLVTRAAAQPVECDPNCQKDLTDYAFGNDGIQRIEPKQQSLSFEDAIVLPSGNMLLSGDVDNQSERSLSLVQIDHRGNPDPTFNVDGSVFTTLGLGARSSGGMTIDSEGRILRTGSFQRSDHVDGVCLRYHSHGAPDLSFGEDGRVVISGGDCNLSVIDHQQAEDGSLIIACNCDRSTEKFVRLVRMRIDGHIDETFGVGGKVDVSLPGIELKCQELAITTDQKIVLLARSNAASASQLFLQRYESGGELDTSFGVKGTLTPKFDWELYPVAFAERSNGGFVIASYNWNGKRSVTVLSAFLRDGQPDLSFGNAGVSEIAIGENSSCKVGGLYQMQDSSLLLGITRATDERTEMSLVAVTPDGQIWPYFGTLGHWFCGFGEDHSVIGPILPRPNGGFCIAGQTGLIQGQFAFLGLDDTQPPTQIYQKLFALQERYAEGSRVAWLVTDNFLRSESIRFELVSGEGDQDNHRFQIKGHFLENREEMTNAQMANMSLRVRAIDAEGRTVDASVKLVDRNFRVRAQESSEDVRSDDLVRLPLRIDPPLHDGQQKFTPISTLEFRTPDDVHPQTDTFISTRSVVLWNCEFEIQSCPESVLKDEQREMIRWPAGELDSVVPESFHQQFRSWIVSESAITDLTWADDQRTLFATLENGELLRLDLPSIPELTLLPGDVFNFEVSKDGQVWYEGLHGTFLFSPQTRQSVLWHKPNTVDSGGFLHRNSRFSYSEGLEFSLWHHQGSSETVVKIWETNQGAPEIVLKLQDNDRQITNAQPIRCKETDYVLVSRELPIPDDDRRECELIRYRQADFTGTTPIQTPSILAIRPTHDGRYAALLHRMGASVVSVNDWRVLMHVEVPGITDAVVSPDGGELCTVTEARQMSVWSIPDGVLLQKALAHPVAALGVDYCPDNLTIGTVGKDGTLRFWRRDSLQLTMELPFGTPLRKVRFLPDGGKVAVQTESQRVFVLSH
ncbi:MAG: protein kinase [Planctomycetaceae bacterium]|nr:protein kinase [Planctomycetaceae bacterium]